MTCACDGTPCDCAAGDCCAGTRPETPETITNQPALSQVSYRTGRYATFLASMLAALSYDGPALAPLSALRTRDPGDFSVALLDSWATVLDVLTFYSERLANEAFLRTAVGQRSVTELAALVGYVPSPGVTASATLAFTLLTAPGSPASTVIPAGTRVQSVPGPGQTAQVFETSADLTALGAWNALPAQTTQAWSLSQAGQSTWITGTTNNISVGDALLFVSAPGGVPGGVPGGSQGPMEFHYVTAVRTDPVAQTTRLTWDQPLSTEFGADAALYVFRRKAALFGVNAPNPQTLAGPNISEVPGWPGETLTLPLSLPHLSQSSWIYDAIYNGGHLETSQVALDAVYPGLTRNASGPPSWLALTGIPLSRVSPANPHSPDKSAPVTSIFTIKAATDLNPGPGLFTLTSQATVLTVDDNPQALVNGAPRRWTGKPPDTRSLLSLYVRLTPQVTAYVGSTQLTAARLPLTDWTSVDGMYPKVRLLRLPAVREDLAATAPGPASETVLRPAPGLEGRELTRTPARQAGLLPAVAGDTIMVVGEQRIPAGQPAGVSGKRLRLRVTAASAGSTGSAGIFVPFATFTPAGSSDATVVGGQVFLIDAFPPDIHADGNTTWSVLTVSGVAGTLAVPVDTALTYLPSDGADPVATEAVVVQAATPLGDETELGLSRNLARIYDRSTVTVNANAVPATNGETVQEILGSGDATNPGLSFTLKQAPLTYLPAQNSSGAASTLQVWVNNLRWQEAPNLLTAGPADRVYTTSVNAAGNTVVRFGDGTRGGRPPTGQANLRAVYRKGIGSAGMVAAGQLSQPLDRPQGLSGVTNPGAATGAADPATTDEIRQVAPLPTLTISRVVSLADYQDYALAFAGIAKALATWTWSGDLRGVFLTVTGANGATLAANDPIVLSLAAALRHYGDPHVPLTIVSGRLVLFTFAALVAVDTTSYDPPLVLAQAWQAVSAAFAFGQRGLGQGVAASEIIEVIQGVPGVLAVRLTGLRRSGQPGGTGPVLRASGPRPPSGTQPPLGAELLLLDPAVQRQFRSWS